MTELTEKLDALHATLGSAGNTNGIRMTAQMALIIQHHAPPDFMQLTPHQIARWALSLPTYSSGAA